MARESDFLFVGQPHDPRSISGSDPYNDISGHSAIGAAVRETYSASLAVWYSIEDGWYLMKDHNIVSGTMATDNYDAPVINTIYDKSENPGDRDLRRMQYYWPVLSQSGYLPGDSEKYITCYDNNTDGLVMRNDSLGASYTTQQVESSWITINQVNKGASTGSNMPGPHSCFFTAMFVSEDNDSARGFGVNYGQESYNGRSHYGTAYRGPFVQSLRGGSVQNYIINFQRANRTNHYLIGGHYESNYRYNNHNGWHALSMVYDNRPYNHPLADDFSHVTAAFDGEIIFNGDTRETDSYKPHVHIPTDGTNQRKLVSLGAQQSTGPELGGDNRADSRIGFMDYFVFESALSPHRRQQMERFQCDRAGILMRDTYWLSEFYGGPQGAPHPHSAITPSGAAWDTRGSYCRKYAQEPTASGHPKIHYETAAGAFFNKSVSGSAFQSVTGSTSVGAAISLRAWVRAENLDATDHTGSHIALVAKASSPFGNKMDNIKGYALKFGTFNDASNDPLRYTGSTANPQGLGLRLSTRDARYSYDGTVQGTGSNDTFLAPVAEANAITTGSWYQIRMDVVPEGTLELPKYLHQPVPGNMILTGSDTTGAQDSYFGQFTSCTSGSDGLYILSTAQGDDTPNGGGAAYINFVPNYSGSALTSSHPTVQELRLRPTDVTADWRFGDHYSDIVSSSIDGHIYVAVPSTYDDSGAGGQAGSVYIYKIDTTSGLPADMSTKVSELKLTASNNRDWAMFGRGTRIISGSNALYVAAGAADHQGGNDNAGAVYVYEIKFNNGTFPGDMSSGVTELMITASNQGGSDWFGWRQKGLVSGSSKLYVSVGAHGEDTKSTNRGAAYVFEIDAANSFPQDLSSGVTELMLTGTHDTGQDAEYGGNTNIVSSSNGLYCLVTAYQEHHSGHGDDPGSAFLYEINTGVSMPQEMNSNVKELYITASNTQNQDHFGDNVNMLSGSDGIYFTVASRFRNGSRGAVYVYRVAPSASFAQEMLGWAAYNDYMHEAYLTSSVEATTLGYGAASICSGSGGFFVAVGAYGSGSNRGSTYLYNLQYENHVAVPYTAKDTIEVRMRYDEDSEWELLTSKEIDNTDNEFRFSPNHENFHTSKTKAANGIYNGYYVAVSSSTGEKIDTTYFIDGFEMHTDSTTE